MTDWYQIIADHICHLRSIHISSISLFSQLLCQNDDKIACKITQHERVDDNALKTAWVNYFCPEPYSFFLVWLNSLCLSQQSFSPVGTGLPGLNQYQAADTSKVSCSRTQHSNSAGGEAQTSNPLIPSLTLYQLSHCAPQNFWFDNSHKHRAYKAQYAHACTCRMNIVPVQGRSSNMD